MDDVHNLRHFVAAQEPVYPSAVAELRAGAKRSHWMWFIFPQIEGLGTSDMARRYAIRSLDEARAYLRHPVLGARLRECSGIVAALNGRSAEAIFGYPDDRKFRSSMTLFSRASDGEKVFDDCLRKYFDGQPDPATIGRIGH